MCVVFVYIFTVEMFSFASWTDEKHMILILVHGYKTMDGYIIYNTAFDDDDRGEEVYHTSK